MADSLEEKAKDRSIQKDAQVNPNLNTANAVPDNANANSIDDVVEQGTEQKQEKATLGRIVKDLLIISPIAAAATALVGPAAFLTPIGLSLGGHIADRKAGRKTQWSTTRKRLGLGFPGAVFGYWGYQFADFLSIGSQTLLGKIARTLAFNPLVTAPWLLWYKTSDYILQKHGFWKGFVWSIPTLKIFKYLKEAYREKLKGKFWNSVKETFYTLSPIHFYSMNYVADPFYRLAIGSANDVLVAMIAGEEGLLKTIKEKLGMGKKKETVEDKVNAPYDVPGADYKAPAYAASEAPETTPTPAEALKPKKKEPGFFRKYLAEPAKKVYKNLNEGFDKYVAGSYKPGYSKR